MAMSFTGNCLNATDNDLNIALPQWTHLSLHLNPNNTSLFALWAYLVSCSKRDLSISLVNGVNNNSANQLCSWTRGLIYERCNSQGNLQIAGKLIHSL